MALWCCSLSELRLQADLAAGGGGAPPASLRRKRDFSIFPFSNIVLTEKQKSDFDLKWIDGPAHASGLQTLNTCTPKVREGQMNFAGGGYCLVFPANLHGRNASLDSNGGVTSCL